MKRDKCTCPGDRDRRMVCHLGKDGRNDGKALKMKETNVRDENRELGRSQVMEVRGLHPRLYIQITRRTFEKVPHSSPVPRDLDSASWGESQTICVYRAPQVTLQSRAELGVISWSFWLVGL